MRTYRFESGWVTDASVTIAVCTKVVRSAWKVVGQSTIPPCYSTPTCWLPIVTAFLRDSFVPVALWDLRPCCPMSWSFHEDEALHWRRCSPIRHWPSSRMNHFHFNRCVFVFFCFFFYQVVLPLRVRCAMYELLHRGDRRRPAATSSPFVVCCICTLWPGHKTQKNWLTVHWQ